MSGTVAIVMSTVSTDSASARPAILRRGSIALCLLVIVAAAAWIRLQPIMLSGLDDLVVSVVDNGIMDNRWPARPGLAEDERRRRLDAWIEANRSTYDNILSNQTRRAREALSLRTASNRDYPYMSGFDSYLWLRVAQNRLETGTGCDRVVDGSCRNTHTLAPVGGEMIYGDTMHVRAIVAVHRVTKWFDPDAPLDYSAQFVPVILGALIVVPAFLIGLRLAGPIAGLVAAVLVASNKLLLQRTTTGDNDIWNIALPLLAFWLLVEAVRARHWWIRAALAAAAGAAFLFHAGIWSGWSLGFATATGGLIAAAGLETLRAIFSPKNDPARAGAAGAALVSLVPVAALVLVVIVGGLFTGLGETVAAVPGLIVATLAGVGGGAPTDPVLAGPWPSVFWTVAELQEDTRWQIAQKLGGPVALAAVLGLFLMVVPRDGFNRWHVAILIWIAAMAGYLGLQHGGHRIILPLALAAAPAIVLLGDLRGSNGQERKSGTAAALMIILWFLAAVYMGQGGTRFVMLLVAPFAIAAGVAAQRLIDFAWAGTASRPMALRAGATSAAIIVTLAVLAPAATAGYRSAVAHKPILNDSWWKTFDRLKRTTAKNAIITTWWDYGHWAKYIADRRVTADGASLLTHVPHWVGRAFSAANPLESIGLIRMLNCGSDAVPFPEGEQGAFARLVRAGLSHRQAYDTVIELARSERDEAVDLLTGLGLDEDARRGVLSRTHCLPPQSLIVLSSRDLTTQGWLTIGSWDYGLSLVISQIDRGDVDGAVSALVREHGYAQQAARQFAALVQHTRNSVFRKRLASAPFFIASTSWHRCRRTQNNVHCPINVKGRFVSGDTQSFQFPPGRPDLGKLRIWENGAVSPTDVAPNFIHIAEPRGLRILQPDPPTARHLSILYDPRRNAVLMGSKQYLRSLAVQLLLLDGRYAPAFRKRSESTSIFGERITAWEVRFPNR